MKKKESLEIELKEIFMSRKIIFTTILCALFAIQIFSQTNQNSEMKKMPDKSGDSSKMVTAEEAQKNALNVGAKMPSFTLLNEKNEQVKSEDLLKEGNLVIVFYRGAWCPYCNLYLKSLQKNLDKITESGGKLVAVSVENPDTSLTVSQKNELKFTVLSDRKLEVARKFGIVFQLPQETNDKYKGYGIDLVKQNETETPDLPLSATYIVKQNGEIVYAFLEPDYTKRAEPSVIIENLTKIKNNKIIKKVN